MVSKNLIADYKAFKGGFSNLPEECDVISFMYGVAETLYSTLASRLFAELPS